MSRHLQALVAMAFFCSPLTYATESPSGDSVETIHAPLEGTREQYVQQTKRESELGLMRERADAGELQGMLELAQSIMLDPNVSPADLPAANQLLQRAAKLPNSEAAVAALRESYQGLKDKFEGRREYTVKYVNLESVGVPALPQNIEPPVLTYNYGSRAELNDVLGITECGAEPNQDQACMQKRLAAMKKDLTALKLYRNTQGWTFDINTPEKLIEEKAKTCQEAAKCIDPATYLMNRVMAGFTKDEKTLPVDYEQTVIHYWAKPLQKDIQRANDPINIRIANSKRAKALGTPEAEWALGLDNISRKTNYCSLIVNAGYAALLSDMPGKIKAVYYGDALDQLQNKNCLNVQ
ncbi:hypothetical protein [Pseudomonas putida]|uniref:hypothetical protein n=1 Tax=Pseudomonas putida TaxID=303 RepID=UPI000AC52DDC|nr:hypothetical protein [Pseudomonas putida]MCE0972878.1 hypothetical protein [Pseudomonas putida]MDD2119528.1 hypothetical protein [Pseudomonas putida]UPU90424.1 hypothetical protein M0766_15980 [Pseudomonas putida]HDS1729086.1 hypothetical protein [Pseudomonas putida]